MPNKCCVFGCRSNYNKQNEASSFKFPKDDAMREKWLRSINRKDFTPTTHSVVCIKHFAEQFIIREDRMTRDDGTVIVALRSRPALTTDAYPSLFPNQPSYLSKEPPPKRISPDERHERIAARSEECFENWMEQDMIESFQSFCDDYMKHNTSTWLVITKSEYTAFLKVNCDEEKPNIEVSFKVMCDLTVKVWYRNMPLPKSKFRWLLGDENVCKKWSAFDCLLSHLSSYNDKSVTDMDKLEYCISVLHEILEKRATDENESISSKVLWFCTEQLALVSQKRKKYSPDFLIWACTVYYSSPSCYKLLRSSGIMNLPHPDYLRKLALKHGKFGSGLQSEHILYLKEIISCLKEKEKLVNVLLDEIHVQKRMSYKGGQLHGASTNSTDVATTIQVFMITSPLSSYKHVVALFPVCNLTTDTLLQQTETVIKVLHDIGFQVLTLVSDNNRVNRHMFEKLCGGSLTSFIRNPCNHNDCIFLLFDTVHLLKCIRNNWLNKKNPAQTFVFPSPENPNVVKHASLSSLKTIHSSERTSHVKLAPGLSEKSLYPTNLERQNVHYALQVFDEKSIAALKEFSGLDSSGTVIFLQQVISWWNIVNVKTPFKGVALRQEQSNPITQTSSHDPNLSFLAKFCVWLDAWEELNNSENKGQMRAGKLSKETHFALRHTTSTLIKLSDYLLQYHQLKYILLGKFQTDKLESRFGVYRQMSGGNYNVSVEQVLESENKLKIVNLLSLKSSHSNVLHITDMNTSSVEDEESSVTSLDLFDGIHDEVTDHELSHTDEKVMIYISGYVGHTMQKKCTCSLCRAKICSKNVLDVEISEENCQYTKHLNRGGLKWPTEFTLDICTNTYKIFHVLMSTYEKEFLNLANHRTVLMTLSINYLQDRLDFHETCICGTSNKQLIERAVRSVANILLNNYTKNVNDSLVHNVKAKKRKLSTFKT